MKRIFSYILILAVILQIFAPFAVGVNQKNFITKNIVGAASGVTPKIFEEWNTLDGFKNAFSGSSISEPKITCLKGQDTCSVVSVSIDIETGYSDSEDSSSVWARVINRGHDQFDKKSFVLVVRDASNNILGYTDLTTENNYRDDYKTLNTLIKGLKDEALPPYFIANYWITYFHPLDDSGTNLKFERSKTYTLEMYYKAIDLVSVLSDDTILDDATDNKLLKYVPVVFISSYIRGVTSYRGIASTNNGTKLFDSNGDYFKIGNSVSFTTSSVDQETIPGSLYSPEDSTKGQGVSTDNPMPECGFNNILGCVAQVLYYAVFKPTSFIFGLAGQLMDVSLMYSLSDSSYRSTFITEGWKITRDLCNMFFIFALLYLAFTTILDLGGSKNKSSIVNIIIIGLFINFSLFATQLVIDASNVLARVFYSPKVMIIGPKDKNGNIQGKTGDDFGEIKLSEAIVSKVDPQVLLSEVSTVSEASKSSANESTQNIGTGSYVLITLLASAVNIVGTIAFLGITLAFVGRVIGLWLAMVLSPLAFFTFVVPQLKDKDYIGWSKWWPQLLSVSFMAPIFVFFMYIIVMFLEKKLGFTALNNSSIKGMSKLLSIILPFIFIIFLINKAKKIAVDMSGEIGKAMANVSQKITGVAATALTGGVMGAAAMGMRGTIGRAGASIANSEKLKEMEAKGGIRGFGAKTLRSFGSSTGKAGFDFRNTKMGAEASANLNKELGVSLGKGKTGGYQEFQNSIVKKQTEEADSLKMSAVEVSAQDAKAKEYKKKYEKAMYAERLAIEKNGGAFSEKDFKKKYEEGGIDSKGEKIEAHGPREKTSEEIYKERVRKLADSKSRDGVFGANANTEAAIIKDLKAKGKEEKKEVTAHDRYKASKKIDIADSVIAKAEKVKRVVEKELKEIDKTLEAVAKELGGGLTSKDIKPKHIEKIVKNKQNLIVGYEANIAKYQSQLNDPAHPNASRDLTRNLGYKKKAESDINKYSSILDTKEKANEKIEKQDETITNQNNIKSEQEDIKTGK